MLAKKYNIIMGGKIMVKMIHPVWGDIYIDEKFQKVLQIREYQELANKSQLGTQSLSKKYVMAIHNRSAHSLGVLHVTEKLIKHCERKFKNYFEISYNEKMTLLLAALSHDLGHTAFSHSLEKIGDISHEERTIKILENRREEINEIFGFDITSGVISILDESHKVKKSGNDYNKNDIEHINIIFVLISLLVGTIDCDRIEYLTTDKFMLTGKRLDFTKIFNHITIVLFNDAPTVGFEREAVPMIEELLLTRFNQYLEMYFDKEGVFLDMMLNQYAKLKNWNENDLRSLSEYDIILQLKSNRNDERLEGTQEKRISELMINGIDEDLMFKKFEYIGDMKYFIDRLENIIKNSKEDIKYYTTSRKVAIYDTKKNKVAIRDDDEIVRDITEVSDKISESSIEVYFIMIDLKFLRGEDFEISEDIRELFTGKPVEVEKKFIPSNNMNVEVKEIIHLLKSIPNLNFVGELTETINFDTYLEPLTKVPDGAAMRLRVNKDEGKPQYYLKLPAGDGTSITKRKEFKYPVKTQEEFLELVKALFISKGYEFDENIRVKDGIIVTTIRNKVICNVFDSNVEVAIDCAIYKDSDTGAEAKDFMIECELKFGKDLALWHLTKYIKKLGFEVCNESKIARAKKAFAK